jgi:hypothetical protein
MDFFDPNGFAALGLEFVDGSSFRGATGRIAT